MIFSIKNELRKKYLSKRESLSSKERKDLSEQIFRNYISQFCPIENQNIHIFLPILNKSEVITDLWINLFWKNNIHVFIPKIRDNNIISVKYTSETKLIKNKWDILEAESNCEEIDLDISQVITPLVYADVFGNRVGYGKGFYDRFFSSVNPSAKKIGLGFFAPKEIISDIEKTDVALDYLITPEGILSFSAKTPNFTK